MRFTSLCSLRPWAAGALCLLLAGAAHAEGGKPSNAKLGARIPDVALKSADGKPLSLHGFKDKKAVVVVFLNFDCPVSNSYAQPLALLARQYGDRGVAFLGVCCNPDEDAAALAKHVKEFAIPFPVAKDDRFAAADALKADTTPSAFVLDHNFVLRYRGRIDDEWQARLKRNQKIRSHDLRKALDELLAGKPVSAPATEPVGCPLQGEKQVKKTGDVTYYRDVLPILQNNCQSCHRPGEVGPFSLLTYRQAVTWAQDIKDYTHSRQMPPWKITEGVAYQNERKLSDEEIATLAKWVDAGTPEGDPKDAPPPVKFTTGWQLGEPDLVLEPKGDFVLGPGGRDLFRCFVLPTNLPEDKYVVAIEVRPGNPRVVHHTLNFIDVTGQGRKLEEKAQKDEQGKKDADFDRGPGYSMAMGIGFLPRGGLSGWAPGQRPYQVPKGFGFLLPKGADVIMQVHYHRDGRLEKDRTRIGLYFAKSNEGVRQFQGGVIQGRFFAIPANQERYKVTGTLNVPSDCTLHSIMPHMHLLGKEIKVTLRPPEGDARTLLAIKDWDYNWQETYFLKEPLKLKAGSKLEVEAFYDNSAKNPNNPNNPPKVVLFGEQTTNEMCFVFLGATSDKPGRIFGRPGGRPRQPDQKEEPKPAEGKKP
ncbi:MAG TPA: redoxin domain-containing protein [Gemmataceae bacterium]|nr:redoxin domain-containing protein [Gemmataceae bacterium]